MENKEKFVAYSAGDCEFESFETFEEAEKWLRDFYDDGISEEAMNGKDFIAKITHRSSFEITDSKENYHEHTETCPEDCDEEEWPYDNEWDNVGDINFVEVKS